MCVATLVVRKRADGERNSCGGEWVSVGVDDSVVDVRTNGVCVATLVVRKRANGERNGCGVVFVVFGE
jgi:hypothetical protein